MPEAPVGDLDDLLRELEAGVLQYLPACAFYFGPEEMDRPGSAPSVVWVVEAGDADREIRAREEGDTRSFQDDNVRIVAHCVGTPRLPASRRAQLAASLQVFLAVSWTVQRLHEGFFEDLGWKPVHPKGPSDSSYPVDYTFALRVARMEPAWDQVQLTEVQGSQVLE